MTPSQLVIKLAVEGTRELQKVVKDLQKVGLFGGGGKTGIPGQQGKGGPAEQSKLIKALGADYEKYARIVGNVQKQEMKSADELTKKLKEQIGLIEELNSTLAGEMALDKRNVLKDKIDEARDSAKDLANELANLDNVASGGAAGGGVGSFLSKTVAGLGAVGMASLAWKVAAPGLVGDKESLLYGPRSAAAYSQTKVMGNFAVDAATLQAMSEAENIDAVKAGVANRRWATLGMIPGAAWAGAKSLFSSDTKSPFERYMETWDQQRLTAQKEGTQEWARTAAAGLSPAEAERRARTLQMANSLTKAGFVFGRNSDYAKRTAMQGSKDLSFEENLGISIGLVKNAGRGNEALVSAVARGVEKGIDASISTSAIAAGAGVGAQGAFLAGIGKGGSPLAAAVIAQGLSTSTGAGTWMERGIGMGAGYSSLLAFGASGSDAERQLQAQKMSLGANIAGSVLSGGSSALQRTMNLGFASEFAKGDPYVADLLSKFGSNPREVADFMKSGVLPSYLVGAGLESGQVRSYLQNTMQASIANLPGAQGGLRGNRLLNAIRSGTSVPDLVKTMGVDAFKEEAKLSSGLLGTAMSMAPAEAEAYLMALGGFGYDDSGKGGRAKSKGAPGVPPVEDTVRTINQLQIARENELTVIKDLSVARENELRLIKQLNNTIQGMVMDRPKQGAAK